MKQKSNHIPKKSFGQNFLFNKHICSKIVDLIENPSNKNILEIGPGKGALTDFLYHKNCKSLTLIEKDRDLILNLKEKFAEILIINDDALKITIKDMLNKIKNKADETITIIGNLPYNIGTILILKWLQECNLIDEIIVMLQKEVAERFTAKQATKNYGVPSILAQKYYDIKIKIEVSPNNFFPKPKVDSAVLVFKKKKNVEFILEEFLFVKEFISIAFQSRRKKIKPTIIKFLGKSPKILENEFQDFFDKRIEMLSVNEIFELCNKIKNFSLG